MDRQRVILGLAVVLGLGWAWLRGAGPEPGWLMAGAPMPARAVSSAGLQKAVFATGCFWSTESDFEKVSGVVSAVAGYTGGRVANPTYGQVSRGGTGHAEAVEVTFDPAVVSYERLLDHFWHNVDPFVADRQFCDVGDQYRPAIFVRDAAQRTAAEASKAGVQNQFKAPIRVEVTDAETFYVAEEYHQDYTRKNPVRYRYYRWGCGRDQRLEEIWANASSGTHALPGRGDTERSSMLAR
jgi:peptide-methionine (S)-S-oxide reductase